MSFLRLPYFVSFFGTTDQYWWLLALVLTPFLSLIFFYFCGCVAMWRRQQRAFNVQMQDEATSTEQPAGAAVSNCRTISDVRMSETKRTGAAFSSPMANNEAIPNWRPPATGSSHRHGSGNHYRLQKSSQRYKHRDQRQAQRRHYQQEQEECRNYPLRRTRPYCTMPSIRIHSPSTSSSNSYSNLTNTSQKAKAMISR